MARKIVPWPIEQMKTWYEKDGNTCQEIADLLSSEEWQPYWIEKTGERYKLTAKLTQKVLKRSGCAMRPRGAPASRNGNWSGGRIVDRGGYILVKCQGHPYANHLGYVREHRLVMEKILGRYLEPEEVVHHIDDDPSNNDPGNLALFQHNRIHVSETMKGKVSSGRIQKAIAAAAEAKRGHKRPKHWKTSNPPLDWPIELMVRWYTRDGLACHQIGNLLNRSTNAVRHQLVASGVQMRPASRRIPPPITDSHQLEASQLDAKYRGNPRRDAGASKRMILQTTG